MKEQTLNIEKLLPQIVKALLALPEWPWLVASDDAPDFPSHKDSGLALVDTGRAGDWPIARLCEWNTAPFIAASPFWLASLVVGIVEKEADLCNVSHYEVNGQMGGHSCTKGALSRFNISQADYEEIKRRVEK